MSGRPSAELIQAMEEVKTGKKSPYAAARDANIALSTMYRSTLYKEWKAEQDRLQPKQAAK